MKKIILTLIVFFTYFLSYPQQKSADSLAQQTSQIEEKKFDLKVMPYLSYNRNLKFMIGAIPMLMYKLDRTDTISPKSLSGVSAVYTTNNSFFFAFFNRWYFKEDIWRAKFFALAGNHNSQFYMESMDVDPGFYDYRTKPIVASFGIQRKIITNLYGGLTYTYTHFNTKYEDDIQDQEESHNHGLELNLLYDSRNAVYYPTSGTKAQLRYTSFPTWFGNDESANKIRAEYNRYFPMRTGTDVLAARFASQIGLGDISFEQQVTIGNKDIRGYSEGKYRGDGIIALQGEYRYNFSEKMGLVGFAGIATIYGSETDDFNWKAYPGGGIGYRYLAFKAVKFNIGLDAAVGKGDWSINFRIGESF